MTAGVMLLCVLGTAVYETGVQKQELQQDLLQVTLQLHPRISVCLVTFRRDRDCVSARMQQPQRLRIRRRASVETCLLACSTLPQTVASLVRAHLKSASISPTGAPQGLQVPQLTSLKPKVPPVSAYML